MGKKPKKIFIQGKMPRKKIRAKKKGKKKIHAEGRSNCDFYLRWPNTVFQCIGVSKHYLKTTYF